MTFTIGDTIGAYRLVEQLGYGDMATVFKAHHAVLDRYVAVKVLSPLRKDDPDFLERFRREAQAVAQLTHPNIVPIYDFAEHEDWPYLVMKYVEGESLHTRLAWGRLPVGDCARILGAVGRALAYAHQHGILHRGLKPSNILLETHGDVFLADFGMARIAGRAATGATAKLVAESAEYASPEQLSGSETLDEHSDQYSLGVILFEMITGQLPFKADNALPVSQQHLSLLPPRPSELNPLVTPAMEDIILRALVKQPYGRFPTVTEMVEAFQRAAAPPRPPTAPIRLTPTPSSAFEDETTVLTPAQLHGKDISVMLVLQPTGQLFFLSGKEEYWLGRSEPTRPFKPDLDLAEMQGMEQGVSRKHGTLRFDQGRLLYTDMNSSNGSRINGEKLRPEIPVVLNDGDELCLGRMVFRVYFSS